jgi:ferredoxin-type protein NapG
MSMKRQEFFTRGLKELAGSFAKTPVGRFVDRRLLGLANLLAPEGLQQPASYSVTFPRPPGATSSFNSLCTRCGDCIAACPYGALFQFHEKQGPVLNPNFTACQLCSDWPCIKACETGALQKLPEQTLPAFGRLHVYADRCLNFANDNPKIAGTAGTRSEQLSKKKKKNFQQKMARANKGSMPTPSCSSCQTACPVAGVISYSAAKLPEVAGHCTGCGMCVPACPTGAVEVQW